MAMIPFTRYLRPNGQQALQEIPTDDETAALAVDIVNRGFRFEVEVLTTGEVSLTVFDPEEEVDVEIEVVPDGPEVPGAVKRLVRSMAKQLTPTQTREAG